MKKFMSLVATTLILVSCGRDNNNQVSQAELQNQNGINPGINGVGVMPLNNGQWNGQWNNWNNWGQGMWRRNPGFMRWGGNTFNPNQGWNYSRRNCLPRRVPRGCFYYDTSNPNVQNFNWPADCDAGFVQSFHAGNQALDQIYNCNTVEELANNIGPVIGTLSSFERSYPNTYCTHTNNKGSVTMKGTLHSSHLTSSLKALRIYQTRINNSMANECTSDIRLKVMAFSNEVRDLELESKFEDSICGRIQLSNRIAAFMAQHKDTPSCYVTQFVKIGNTKKLLQESVSIDGLMNLQNRLKDPIKNPVGKNRRQRNRRKKRYAKIASNCR